MTDFTKKVIRSSHIPIHFIVGEDSQGHIVHYFLRCSAEKLKRLENATVNIVRPHDYGIVVASGFGSVPSIQTKRLLSKQFDYDYDQLIARQQDSVNG